MPGNFIYYPPSTVHERHVRCENGQQDIPINKLLRHYLDQLVPVVEDHDPWHGQISFQGTEHQVGWTWRSYAPDADMDNMALLFTNVWGQTPIYTMSFGHYARCYNNQIAARHAYLKFFQKGRHRPSLSLHGRWLPRPVGGSAHWLLPQARRGARQSDRGIREVTPDD